jgi:hypothetical protein
VFYKGIARLVFKAKKLTALVLNVGKIVTDCNCIPFTFLQMCSTAIIQSILCYCVPQVMSKRIVSDKTWENRCKVSIRYDIIVPCKSGRKSIKAMISKII